MSDVIVLPPSGDLLICQCVTQGSQKRKKKEINCVSVLFNKVNKHESQHSSILLSINFTFTGI